MAYEILIKASAEKEIRHLPRNVRERVNPAILALREEPRPLGVRKLMGKEGWRIRWMTIAWCTGLMIACAR